MTTDDTLQTEIIVAKGKATKAINQLGKIEITSPEELAKVGDLRIVVKTTLKEIKEKKEAITKPINEGLKKVRALFAPVESQLDDALVRIDQAISAYQRAVAEEVRRQEAELQKKLAEGNVKASELINEPVVAQPKTVEGNKGKLMFRTVQKLRVADITKVPLDILNDERVHEAVLRIVRTSGSLIPDGIEQYEEQEIVSR